MSANCRIVVTGEAGLTGCTLENRLLSDGREVTAVNRFGHIYPSWLESTSKRYSAQRSGSAGAAGASRSVTSGCALKPIRDEFQVDVVWRKIDQLHREVGR